MPAEKMTPSGFFPYFNATLKRREGAAWEPSQQHLGLSLLAGAGGLGREHFSTRGACFGQNRG